MPDINSAWYILQDAKKAKADHATRPDESIDKLFNFVIQLARKIAIQEGDIQEDVPGDEEE